jgi:hypothetical protein
MVNRFKARYRLARAFRGLDLEGFSRATQEGYSALTKVSLHWSAFEAMLLAFGLGDDARSIARGYDFSRSVAAVRRYDPGDLYFTFVREMLDARSPLKRQLRQYLAGGPVTTFALAKALRHIYFHGHLTPNAREVAPGSVVAICNVLTDSLVFVMDEEFSSRADDLLAFSS